MIFVIFLFLPPKATSEEQLKTSSKIILSSDLCWEPRRVFHRVRNHSRQDEGLAAGAPRCWRRTGHRSSLACSIPSFLPRFGGVNHCNEWLITSSRPGGCCYFQLIKRLDESSV